MNGDIFYSEVDPNLWTELNARGQAGVHNRGTTGLQYMLEKIANVMIMPYNTINGEPGTSIIQEAILGGYTVRSGEYLPSGPNGFLTDRKYTLIENGFNDLGNIEEKYNVKQINTSKRIPPFITSLDMNIGDHSNGMLNSVTVNFTVPNPERDLNYIESIYYRPGRKVTVIIEHPNSAVLSSEQTGGMLSDETLPSFEETDEFLDRLKSVDGKDEKEKREKLKKLFLKKYRQYRHLNMVRFDGIIQSFTIDYQSDMSVQSTIQIIGTSNVYTDISLIINSSKKEEDTEKKSEEEKIKTEEEKLKAAQEAETKIFSGFYANLNTQVNTANSASAAEIKKGINSADFLGRYYIKKDGVILHSIEGYPIQGVESQRYIDLKWLITYINDVITSKQVASIPTSNITFNDDISTTRVPNQIISSNPLRVLLASKHRYSSANPESAEQGDKIDDFYWKDGVTDQLAPGGGPIRTKAGDVEGTIDTWERWNELEADDDAAGTVKLVIPRIKINMSIIEETCISLEKQKRLTVSALLEVISAEVYEALGGAVNLQLITHPEQPEVLLWHDSHSVKAKPSTRNVKPYPVPMFSNHPFGTIVRDFKFSGQLPQDATNLSYVLNSDPSEISESDIAPYVSFMYSANTVSRSGPHETISSILTEQDLENIKKRYKEAHDNFKTQLIAARSAYGKDFKNNNLRLSFNNALKKYIQYPTDSIVLSNELAAPVIPFDVEFTTDGINGFRYGDILTFDGLPDRYKKNAVFPIVNITHTISTDGQWTTTVRCIMRPKIE